MSEDYYSVLNISYKATIRDIRATYLKRILYAYEELMHGNKEYSFDDITKINKAYLVLKDELKRKWYDERLEMIHKETLNNNYDLLHSAENDFSDKEVKDFLIILNMIKRSMIEYLGAEQMVINDFDEIISEFENIDNFLK